MGIIFDLDQTLIDSRVAEPYRPNNWKKVYSLIPEFTRYDGVQEIFEYIQAKQIQVAIVSTAPNAYCQKVLKYWEIPHDYIVGYHDTTYKKPHAEPMIKALSLLKLNSDRVISLGDRGIDIQSSKAANIKSVGCLWGSSEDLKSCSPDYLLRHPNEVLPLLKEFF